MEMKMLLEKLLGYKIPQILFSHMTSEHIKDDNVRDKGQRKRRNKIYRIGETVTWGWKIPWDSCGNT